MRRISQMTHDEIIAYNLRDNGTAVAIFADTQAYRVEKARWFISQVLPHLGHPAVIWEPGCSAGDISGFFSEEHEVHGIDVVPAAVAATRARWPAMDIVEAKVEDVAPVPCDVLVLTEFLEHVIDPEALIRGWLPLAKFVVIGHPLNDPGSAEPGHIWSYEFEDYLRWFGMGGHRIVETHLFSGPFPEMVMGLGISSL